VTETKAAAEVSPAKQNPQRPADPLVAGTPPRALGLRAQNGRFYCTADRPKSKEPSHV
jgi:hypothetical protein